MAKFPSEEQEKVILHSGRPLIVIAAPGTGKTSTIVARMIRLLKEDLNREVSFITFTRTSRRDTDKKIANEFDKKALEKTGTSFPRISTLHTYAKSIAHKYAFKVGRLPSFSVLIDDRGERDLLLSELIDDLKIKIDPSRLRKELVCFRCTGSFLSDCDLPLDSRKKLLKHLEILLRFYNTFDMEGLVLSACDIISNSDIVLPAIFLQVDEYQDLNPADQKLISLISSIKGSQVVVVGDDAQSIYPFRHANPVGIRELWNSSDWDKVQFTNCHRLPSHILRAAQSLISKESYLGGKVKLPPDDGNKILALQCTKSDLQISAVANLINKTKQTKTNRDGKPLSFKDFMVLCPISAFVNKVADTLQNDFAIPTKQKEKGNIPDDHWRLLLVLRMLNSSDSLALRQWLNIIGLEEKEITQIRRKALATGKSLYDHCSTIATAHIKEIFISLEKLQKTLDDLEHFRQALKEFPHLSIEDSLFPAVNITINEITQKPNSIGSIIKFIHEKFGLLDPETGIPEDDKVLVTTMHSAKGLEAEFVFIMWLNDNFLPAKDRNPKEELRVFYVALTRAKQDVILTFYERFDRLGSKLLKVEAISPFLKHIISHLKIKRITRDDLK